MKLRGKLISVIVVIAVIVIMAVFLIIKFSPSTEVMPLKDYFATSGEEMTIILQNEIIEETGYYREKTPYLRHEMVKNTFNDRFYWSAKDKIMIYTTPTEVIKVVPETNEYTVDKEVVQTDYTVVTMINEEPYIAAPFVKMYSDIDYKAVKKPNRIMIRSEWGVNEQFAIVAKDAALRYEPSIKSPILVELAEGDEVVFVASGEELEDGFSKVISSKGVIGYVKSNRLEESEYRTVTSSFVAPEYTHITKDYDICMVWHQTTTEAANENLLYMLNATKGVNTISPTWFAISDNKGGVSSIASERYVARAHEAGVEVWGLCNDFGEKSDIDIAAIMADTKVRERLVNKLVSLALEYDLDGLNIDFEMIPEAAGEDYIQFIRELSVKCRLNNLVLSIDNYIPTDYRKYYDYNEQGNVADYIVIMAYDEHYSGGGVAGSVSSLPFVSKAVEDIKKDVNPEQVIMALPFYTRVWHVTHEADGNEKVTSEAYGMTSANNLLHDYGVKASWDEATGQYYAEWDEGNQVNKIWLEEERSLGEKLKVVTSGGIKNVAFWKMGFENTESWNVIADYINR